MAQMVTRETDLNPTPNPNHALTRVSKGRTMPKILSQNGPIATLETTATWKDQNTKEEREDSGTYTAPPTFKEFIPFLQTLAPEIEEGDAKWNKESKTLQPYSLSYAYDAFMQGLDARVKAKIRPAVVTASAWISREDVRINLATGEREQDGKPHPKGKLSLEKCIGAVNAGFQQAELLGSDKPTGAFIVARRELIENKLATLKGDVLVIVPGAKFPNGK